MIDTCWYGKGTILLAMASETGVPQLSGACGAMGMSFKRDLNGKLLVKLRDELVLSLTAWGVSRKRR